MVLLQFWSRVMLTAHISSNQRIPSSPASTSVRLQYRLWPHTLFYITIFAFLSHNYDLNSNKFDIPSGNYDFLKSHFSLIIRYVWHFANHFACFMSYLSFLSHNLDFDTIIMTFTIGLFFSSFFLFNRLNFPLSVEYCTVTAVFDTLRASTSVTVASTRSRAGVLNQCIYS